MPVQSFFKNNGDGTFSVMRRSPISGNLNTLTLRITEDQVWKWNSPGRPLIQECFPNLSPPEREFILTGTTPSEWNDFFKEPA